MFNKCFFSLLKNLTIDEQILSLLGQHGNFVEALDKMRNNK
jgi:hypothetical protein